MCLTIEKFEGNKIVISVYPTESLNKNSDDPQKGYKISPLAKLLTCLQDPISDLTFQDKSFENDDQIWFDDILPILMKLIPDTVVHLRFLDFTAPCKKVKLDCSNLESLEIVLRYTDGYEGEDIDLVKPCEDYQLSFLPFDD